MLKKWKKRQKRKKVPKKEITRKRKYAEKKGCQKCKKLCTDNSKNITNIVTK